MSRTLTGSGFGESAVEPEKGGRAFAVAFVSGAVSGSVRPVLLFLYFSIMLNHV